MITYNQERYVLEHLESIKFQILNYGEDYKFYFVLGDDASKDRTVDVVKRWLNHNKELFENVEILVSDKNIGIVKNVVRTLRCIRTDAYKLLAGDDLYFKNSIFKLDGTKEFILTPFLIFSGEDNKIIRRSNRGILIYKLYLLKNRQNKLFHYIKDFQKYENIIEAPAVFMKHSLIDSKFYNALDGYQWIEDVPIWNYLFYTKGVEMNISFYEIPLVLYRGDVGISTDKNHVKRKLFESDLLKIKKEIYSNNIVGEKISKFIRSFERKIVKYFLKNDEELLEFEKNFRKNENDVENYLKYIRNKVKEYKTSV